MRGKPESCDAMEANRSQSLGEKLVNCVECQRQVESNHNRTLTWQSTCQCCLEKKKNGFSGVMELKVQMKRDQRVNGTWEVEDSKFR